MDELSETKKEINPILKLSLEMGPLIVFFFANSRGEQLANLFPALADLGGPLFIATAFFMVATAVALTASWLLTRTLPLMPVVSGVVIFIFGALTLYLQDEIFIKMKPTIINALFGATLIGGLIFKKPLLKYVLGAAFELDEEGWRILTVRWAVFFFAMAVLNEIIWRNFSTDFWVAFKVWGNFPITVIFMASQFRFLQRHMIEEPDTPS